MGYLHIPNLYKAKEILLFKEVFALEKVHGCLKKGTMIRLANGSDTPIECVKPGDTVISYDEDKQQFTEAVVDDLIVQGRDSRLGWIEVTLRSGRSVICTEDHPLYTTNRGWVKAADLTTSDDIMTA